MVLSQISETVNIFFSFASTSPDTHLFEELRKQLGALKRQGLIDLWYDSAISAGSNVRPIIESYMSTADIIVLLISADFFDSEQCAEVEMNYALQQHAVRATPIIPVLLRPIEWSGSPLEQYSLLPPDGKPVSVWENLDLALKEVAKGIRRVVEDIAGRVLGMRPQMKPPLFPLYLVPHRRHPFFTDRDELLLGLRHYFMAGPPLQTRTQALHGLGGIGKTLLALEYTTRYQHHYQTVLWLNATSREQVHAELLALADQLGLPIQEYHQEQHSFAAIHRWLREHDHWLLVLDNLEEFSLLDQLVPSQSRGHVLFITHSQATGLFAHAVAVPQMTIEEGALLLLRRAKIIAEKESRDAALEADFSQALAITQEVEGYPLALDQVGAYIEETGRSLASYLALYRTRQASLLGIRGRLVADHPDSVTTTLSLTFEKIAQIDPNALELLRFLAFLHPDALPDEMLLYGATSLSAPLQVLLSDPFVLDTLLATLQRFSLIERRADTTTLNIQRIVQVVLLEGLSEAQQKELAHQAVRLVEVTFPEVIFTNWIICERYLPQAQYCAELIHDLHLRLPEAAPLLQRLGTYCAKRALYGKAETYFVQALHLREQDLPANHPDIAQTLNTLALLYSTLGKYAQAEPLYQRALTIREQVLGPIDYQTAQTLNNLGHLSLILADYQRAEQLLLRALAIYEQTLGPEESQTAFALSNLAIVYQKQGDYAAAEPLLHRALAIREQALGPMHPDLAQSLSILGVWYQEQGRLHQAEPLLLRALAMYEQTLGSEHPETAGSLTTLAALYDDLEQFSQAEAFYQRALTISEQISGPTHPDTARLLNNLAFLFRRQGQYQRAEPLYQRALTVYEQLLGTEHPRTVSVLDNLGRLYRIQGQYERAEPLLRRALAIRERVLGIEHLDTARSLNGLAQLLTDQGHYEQAEPLFVRAIAIRQRVFGSEHPDLLPVLENYALLLQQMQRTEEAAALQRMARALREPKPPSQNQSEEMGENRPGRTL